MKTNYTEYLKLVVEKTSLIRALKVAFFVGIILNLINNPQLFQISTDWDIHMNRILLTFLVPFCVSLYSSVLANSNKQKSL